MKAFIASLCISMVVGCGVANTPSSKKTTPTSKSRQYCSTGFCYSYLEQICCHRSYPYACNGKCYSYSGGGGCTNYKTTCY